MERLDCVVAGGGVVGLAVARELALAGREVVVLEAEAQVGQHQSSRNSEVIHAGIYYPEGSLKARLCVEGKGRLYGYCKDRGVAHRNIGKLIVACSEDEAPKLAAIKEQAAASGVNDLQDFDAGEVRAIEPAVECVAALFSPSTGIVDSSGLMAALQADIEAQSGLVVTNSRVSSLAQTDDGFAFNVGDERFACNALVNSAGLRATDLAGDLYRRHGRLPQDDRLPHTRYAKGHYFAYQGKSPFHHLVYPLPSGAWLGIHATNDLGGAVRFGPDLSWVDDIDYAFDDSRKPGFVAAIRRYFPAVDEDKLVPAYTGVRPRLYAAGEPPADFVLAGENEHGMRGLVNVFGIESPGLTSCLAIADYVKQLLD